MARTRQIIPLSFDPANQDAVQVLEALLRQAAPGQRSATIWRWAASYLNGAPAPVAPTPIDDPDDMFDDLLDDL